MLLRKLSGYLLVIISGFLCYYANLAAFECKYVEPAIEGWLQPAEGVSLPLQKEINHQVAVYDRGKNISWDKEYRFFETQAKDVLRIKCEDSLYYECNLSNTICKTNKQEADCRVMGLLKKAYQKILTSETRCNNILKCQENLVNIFMEQKIDADLYEKQLAIINNLISFHQCLRLQEEPQGY